MSKISPDQVDENLLTTDGTKPSPATPYDGLGVRIGNVADPVNPQDVVTLSSLALLGDAARRDHSVNGAWVDFYRNTAGSIMRAQTNQNPAGSYTGGGVGNKAILGHFLSAPLLLSAFLSAEYQAELLMPEVMGPNIIPFANLIVELDPIGNPGVYSVLVFGSVTSPLNLGVYTNPAPNTTKVVWTPANYVNVVNDKGMVVLPFPPGPIIVPIIQGTPLPSSWPSHAYQISDILAVYPNARIVNADPLDGGMPALTIVSGFTLNLGDSGTKIQNAVRVFGWKLNGVTI